jgi:zinc protease
VVGAPQPAVGQSRGASRAGLVTVEGITSYQLPNGLRVLLIPEAAQTKVTVAVTYFVGSRHEGYGETGMAHLLEHMLFKPTPRYPDPDREVERRGGEWNAETEADWTYYFQTHLADQPAQDNLRFALAYEAERMTRARLAQADLDKEFSVVRNELEIGESSPAEILRQRVLRAAFSWHGYGRDTIGSRSDIEHAPIASLRAFYRRYYRPDNAQLTVAGRFDPETVRQWIAASFGPIARPAQPLPVTYTVEPQQDGERQVTLRRTGEVRLVAVAYHALPAAHPDYPAVEAALDVLTREGTGRLYKDLISTGLCTAVQSEAPALVEPGYLWLLAEVHRDHSAEAVRDRMLAAIEGLGKTPVTLEELRRFQARKRKEFTHLGTDGAALAAALRPWSAAGDFRLGLLYRDRIAALTPEKVTAAAQQLLLPSNRTVGLFLPTAQPQRAPLTPAPAVAAQVSGYTGHPPPAPGETFPPTVNELEQRLRRVTLPGGLRLALLPKKTRGATVELALNLRFGSLAELRGQAAAAELLGPMLLRGTRRRSLTELTDALDELQTELTITSGRALPQAIGVRARTLRPHLPALLNLLAEVLREPAFPPSEFTRVQKELVAALEARQQDPLALAKTVLGRALYPWPAEDPRHYASIPEQLQKLREARVQQVAALHQRLVGADSGLLVLIGDFDERAVIAQLTRLFGDWRAAVSYQRIPHPPQPVTPDEVVLTLPDKQLAAAVLALPLRATDENPDYPALRLLEHLLGGGSTARLYHRVRELEGLSYDVEASFYVPPHHAEDGDGAGCIVATATCAPQNARKALQTLLAELGAVAQHGVTPQELQQTKQSYARAREAERADDGLLAERLLELLAENRTLHFDESVDRRLAALTAPAIAELARSVLVTARAIRALAGDFQSLPAGAAPSRR